MRKIFSILVITSLVALGASAQKSAAPEVVKTIVSGSEVNIDFFKGTWAEALEASKKQNKMIFMDCNTVWCVPCKELAKNVFTQKAVADFYNANFINVSMDMEKGDGPQLSREFSVKAYPSLLFLKPGGILVDSRVGLITADSLITAGRFALTKIDEMTEMEKFYKGPRTAEMVKQYFMNIRTNGAPGQEIAPLDTIVKQEGFEAFYQKKYWDLMPVVNVNSPLGLFFVKNHEKFSKIYGEDVVNDLISLQYLSYNALKVINKFQGKEGFDKLRATMAERKLPELEFLNMELEFYLLCNAQEHNKAFDMIDKAMPKLKPWQLYEMSKWADWVTVGNPVLRRRAVKWAAKAAVELKNEAMKEEALQIVDDLMNNRVPTPYPAPRLYGYYV